MKETGLEISRLRHPKMEKVYDVRTYVLSKFNHVVAILQNPPTKIQENIKSAIARFINQGPFRTTKEFIFVPTQFGGLGIPKIFDF